ncbi:MAG: ABC transporter substrate-binding protein [Pseudomonadota bacterium]|nr:ABC transporter substrate-binding protein [Pseudomonadota bacterium]
MKIKLEKNNVSISAKILGALVAVAMFVCGSETMARSPDLEKVIQGAKKEGVLKLLWTEGHMGADAGINDMVKTINKTYGTNIKLQFTQGRSFPANLGRLTQEHRAKQTSSTDVYMGTGSHMLSGYKTGMLQRVDWNKLIERPEPKNAAVQRVNNGGVGVAIASRVVGIVYNTNLIKGSDIPYSIEDVMNPKWKGQIAITPYLTGFYQFAAPDVFGIKFMTDYMKRLKPQIGGFIGCNSLDKIASGQFAMLIFDCGRDATVRYQRRGAPLGHAVPKEIVRNNIINLGVPSNAAHPNVGKLFIAWTHSKDGQVALWKHGAYDLEIYPGSKSKALVDAARSKNSKAIFLKSTVQRSFQQNKDGINVRKFQKKLKKIVRGKRKRGKK